MLRTIIKRILRFFFPIRIRGNNNLFSSKSKVGKNFYVDVDGNNNVIEIGQNCLLTNTNIQIYGEGSKVVIEDNVRLMGPTKIIMGGASTLILKDNAGIRGVEFNLNGAKIEVGKLCMFSYGITVRNHDSHKIINPVDGTIVNPPKDIIIGDHVWIAQNATILKGCNIGENSVVGFGAVVTKGCKEGSVLAGCPASIVKENIIWDY